MSAALGLELNLISARILDENLLAKCPASCVLSRCQTQL